MDRYTIAVYSQANALLDEYQGEVFSENYEPHTFWGDREQSVKVYPSVWRENVWFFVAPDDVAEHYAKIEALAEI